MKHVKEYISPLLLMSVLLLLTACNQHQHTDKNKSDSIPRSETPSLLFAVHPYDNPSKLMARFQPLCLYLSKHLKQKVKLSLASSYGDQIRKISQGKVDLAYMGPTPYLRAHDNYLKNAKKNITIIAGENQNGKASYLSVLIVKKNSPIKKVADLKDHTVAFGATRSFGSYFMPRSMLLDAGLQLHDLKDYEFLGRHERVALAVVHGDFDAGGLRKDIADRYLGRKLRIIAYSPPLPPHVIVARPGLDPDIIHKIKNALLHPQADAKDALRAFSMEGKSTFTPVKDSTFNFARDIVKRMEIAQSRPAQLP